MHSFIHLASSSQKTMLLFVIRDHVGATPLANLSATLTADMNKIWDGLVKVRSSPFSSSHF